MLSPEPFKAAFRHAVDVLRSSGSSNFETVWHSVSSTEPTFGNHERIQWWPGDEYVDHVGISFFVSAILQPFDELADIAVQRGKGLIICESTPLGYELAAGRYTDLQVCPCCSGPALRPPRNPG